jgi:ubiquinone/menaquinone biosynthesis methyltransferase
MPSKNNTGNAAAFEPRADNVFGRIASRYDLLCDFFSFGIHRLWKREVARKIASDNWTTLLDGATGTGDIILRVVAHEQVTGRKILAADLSPEMLTIAKQKLAHHATTVRLVTLDAEAMPTIADSTIDAYSISLGLKICDRQRALREAMRVLRPGGRLIVLEASNISWAPLNRLYLAYMSLCMPAIGWLATGGDSSAYKYLLHGIREFPTAENLAAELESLGFQQVSFTRLSLGIVAIHIAHKPSDANTPVKHGLIRQVTD